MRYDPPDTTDADVFLGEMFNIPEADLDNQLVDITTGEQTQSSPVQPTPTENSDPASDLGDLF